MRTAFIFFSLTVPTASYAEVCDKERPFWNGVPVNMWQEAVIMLTQPSMIFLVMATIFALIYKSRIVCGLLAFVWASLIPMAFTRDLDDITWEASQEGCVGPVDLFIGICAAICMITLYTALRPRRRPTSGDIKCSKD
jgi:hypothetical protein